jgi:hypothetical protein
MPQLKFAYNQFVEVETSFAEKIRDAKLNKVAGNTPIKLPNGDVCMLSDIKQVLFSKGIEENRYEKKYIPSRDAKFLMQFRNELLMFQELEKDGLRTCFERYLTYKGMTTADGKVVLQKAGEFADAFEKFDALLLLLDYTTPPISSQEARDNLMKGLEGYINSPRYKGTKAPLEILERVKKGEVDPVALVKKYV